MWSVPDAKAKLSELLRKARAGEPQVIGMQDPCVVISMDEYRRLKPPIHLGQWLIDNTPRGVDLELPPRGGTHRGDPFEGMDV